MKTVLVSGIFFYCLALVTAANYTCDAGEVTYPENFVKMNTRYTKSLDDCTTHMRQQVQKELDASLGYLYMAAKFSEDQVNRPGLAKKFFDSANEEREHAIKFIEYLLMRGQLDSVKDLITFPSVSTMPTNSLEALEKALSMEVDVTSSITAIIRTCENGKEVKEMKGKEKVTYNDNDYHLVDYLTGVFLEEQFKGQRELAGLISILGKMKNSMGDLGEFLFDKKLLNGELPVVG